MTASHRIHQPLVLQLYILQLQQLQQSNQSQDPTNSITTVMNIYITKDIRLSPVEKICSICLDSIESKNIYKIDTYQCSDCDKIFHCLCLLKQKRIFYNKNKCLCPHCRNNNKKYNSIKRLFYKLI